MDQPIEGWPTRSIITSVADVGHVARELAELGSKPGAFTLNWSETELTSYLGSMLPSGDKVTLWCEPSELYFKYQTLTMKGHSLSVRMSPQLNDNQLQFELSGIWFDNQPLGSWLSRTLQSMLNDILVDSLGQYRLQEFTVDVGRLRVRGELD
ncbi:MAG: hypothetical protein ACYCZF_01925 [Anaerolineae bacterium]